MRVIPQPALLPDELLTGFNTILRADTRTSHRFMFPNENLVTVWSAPNYCYRCGNIASILAFDEQGQREPKLFHAVPDEDRVIPPRVTTPYFL